MADEVTVTLRENGPYLVQGKIKILRADGTEVEVADEVSALCRCGGSSNKPFCDGTHRAAGFEG